jgi:putative transposase
VNQTDETFIQSFNGRWRTECLNTHRVMATGDARQKLEIWRYDDKPERPHGAAGNKPPTLLKI